MRHEEDAYGEMMLAALDGRHPGDVERDDGFFEASELQ